MFIPYCLVSLVLFAQLFLRGSAQTCYWPDNSIAQEVTPCNSAAKNSQCCGPYALCLDNGYADDSLTAYHDTTDGGSVTASTKAMNTATGYPAVDVQIELGTATPAHRIAKRVSSDRGDAIKPDRFFRIRELADMELQLYQMVPYPSP
jgi:hypothetical protein